MVAALVRATPGLKPVPETDAWLRAQLKKHRGVPPPEGFRHNSTDNSLHHPNPTQLTPTQLQSLLMWSRSGGNTHVLLVAKLATLGRTEFVARFFVGIKEPRCPQEAAALHGDVGMQNENSKKWVERVWRTDTAALAQDKAYNW